MTIHIPPRGGALNFDRRFSAGLFREDFLVA
jgi:hypothetical protein